MLIHFCGDSISGATVTTMWQEMLLRLQRWRRLFFEARRVRCRHFWVALHSASHVHHTPISATTTPLYVFKTRHFGESLTVPKKGFFIIQFVAENQNNQRGYPLAKSRNIGKVSQCQKNQ